MTKFCEICEIQIPLDYVNSLCDSCYKIVEEEKERHIALEQEEKQKSDNIPPPTEQPLKTSESCERMASMGISDPNYKENPEAEDKEQWKANIKLFDRNGVLLWKPTRAMYEFIKTECLNWVTQHPQYPKFIWKPKIVDVGMGLGCGSNILSQEADFVWGIDKNTKSVMFAQQAFSRIKNGIYYSSQVTFDEIDIMTENREMLKFDVVVAIEIIEHITDHNKFLENIIRNFDKKDKNEPTIYYISTPNRNNKHIGKDKPNNAFHTKEFTSEEFYDVLSKFFSKIEFFASDGKPTERSTEHTPLLARTQV